MYERCSESKGRSCNIGHVAEDEPAEQEGRRARQRRELLAEIDLVARRLLEEGGAANVSMRAIARGVGLGPASLYTYFDSLDDVLTMLLLSSYRSLASATHAAVDAFAHDPPADRALVGILAYRRWALDHGNEFNLIFTDQLPGYEATPGGPTVDAQVAVFQPILDALAEVAPEHPSLTLLETGVVVWTAFHGAVTLEVNHHLDWLPDTAAFQEVAIRRALVASGIPEPTTSVRRRFERWAKTTSSA